MSDDLMTGYEVIYKTNTFTVFKTLVCGEEFIEICNDTIHIRFCSEDGTVVIEQCGKNRSEIEE